MTDGKNFCGVVPTSIPGKQRLIVLFSHRAGAPDVPAITNFQSNNSKKRLTREEVSYCPRSTLERKAYWSGDAVTVTNGTPEQPISGKVNGVPNALRPSANECVG
jgi:hypothetical protein